MSSYIKKVQFRLHESYPNPIRGVLCKFTGDCLNFIHLVLTIPPFEVHETGWGEFEIQIKIFFTDTTEKPVCCYGISAVSLLTSLGDPVSFAEAVSS